MSKSKAKQLAEVVSPVPVVENPEPAATEKQVITMDSPIWTDWVLSLLRDDEKFEKSPKYIGLRRIFEFLGYRILGVDTNVVQTPDVNNLERSTVVCRITYTDPNRPGTFYWSDAADCGRTNTAEPFSLHPVATASTMAESRVLRKIMRLNTVAAEEITRADHRNNSMTEISKDMAPISDAQKTAITRLSAELDIDVSKLLSWMGKDINNKTDISTLNYENATTILALLNAFNRGPLNEGKSIPVEIKV